MTAPLTSYAKQIIQQLQRVHSVETILALHTDEWQSATQLYNQISAPIQTKIKRINELIELGIAHEKRQPPGTFGRRRDLKLNPTYTRLQKLLHKTKQELLKEITNLEK
ncbi:MAG: hypothetical protein LN416_07735 [Candidatus Thermoplasmatota archaeon]|nr:hypothetical protein [Candidatus Thermoplasmatota archaeon]